MQGVTVPKSQPEVAPAQFGFVDNAERINSRACMVCCGLLLAFSVELPPKPPVPPPWCKKVCFAACALREGCLRLRASSTCLTAQDLLYIAS